MTKRRNTSSSLVLEIAVLTERVKGLEALVTALRERAEAAEARAQAVAESPTQGAGFAALAPSKLAELEAQDTEADPEPVVKDAPFEPKILWLAPPPPPAATPTTPQPTATPEA